MKIYKITFNVVFQDNEHEMPHVSGGIIFFLWTGDVAEAGMAFRKQYLAKEMPNQWTVKELTITGIEWIGEAWQG